MTRWRWFLCGSLFVVTVWEICTLFMLFFLPSLSTIDKLHHTAPTAACSTFAHFMATNYSSQKRPLEEFLVGLKDVAPEEIGVCRLPEGCGQNCEHFPHIAQFLFKCFSYWNHETSTRRVLVTSLVNENPWRPFFKRIDFNRGMILNLYRYFGVHVVNSYPNKTVVIGTDDWDSFTWADPSSDTKAWRDVMVPWQSQIQCSAPRVRILNRRRTRSITNVEDLSSSLSQQVGTKVSVEYFEKTSYAQQVGFMSTTDILISPHGAQLTSLAVMPDCGAVLELFPKGYYTPKFFGSLAATSLHDHYTAYNGIDAKAEMKSFYQNHSQRVAARSVNFCVNPQDIRPMVHTMMKKWRDCCGRLHEKR